MSKQYRMLTEGEYIRRGDQVFFVDGWSPTMYTLSDRVRAGPGRNYRRPLRRGERRSTSANKRSLPRVRSRRVR